MNIPDDLIKTKAFHTYREVYRLKKKQRILYVMNYPHYCFGR